METCYLLVTILLAFVKTMKADLQTCDNNVTQEINGTGNCSVAKGTYVWTYTNWRKVESNTSWNIVQMDCAASVACVKPLCPLPQNGREKYCLTFMYRMHGPGPLHLDVVEDCLGQHYKDIWNVSGNVINWTKATIHFDEAHRFKSINIKAVKQDNSVIQLANIQYLDSSCDFQTTTDSVKAMWTTQTPPNGGTNKSVYVIVFVILIVAALALVIIVRRFFPLLRRKLSRTDLELKELVEVSCSHDPCPQEFSTSDTAITRYSDGYMIPITNKPEEMRQVPDSTSTIRETLPPRGDNADGTPNLHERYAPNLRASGPYDLFNCPRNLEHVTDYNQLDFTPHNDVTKAGRKAYDRLEYNKGDNYDTLRSDRKCQAIDSNYDHVE